VVRVDLAFQAFFRRVKSGEKEVGYPRFKGYARYDSITFTQVPTGCKLDRDKVVISKVGHVKAKVHRPMRGKAKTATITRSSTGKWYACFSCEVEPERLPQNPNKVGVDVGLYTFASMSDGTIIENPRFFRKEEKALAKVQRRLSKAEKGTSLRTKRRKVVARIHERIGFKRINFSHQQSRKLVNSYGLIAVEDLQVNRMMHNHCIAKSISDAAWSQFFSLLGSKAAEAGYIFIAVNPAYTSQICSECGYRLLDRLTLADRIFDCPYCKLHINRDLNASLNILRIGLDSLSNQSVEATAL
jgi:putative transposase